MIRVRNKLLTNKQYIEDCIKKHGVWYDYSRVIYTGKENKVTIGCPEHGWFDQHAGNHKRGAKCPDCSHNLKMDKSSFSKKADIVHNEIYDYSKVIYLGNKVKVEIGCKKHGTTFWQRPNDHLMGQGCPTCGNERRNDLNTKTTEQFLKEVVGMHPNVEYTDFVYHKHDIESKFICKRHGEFNQTPDSHLKGYGCPDCSKAKVSLAERELRSFIKNLNIDTKLNDKTVLDGKEIDILVPDLKIGFEFDGIYWHDVSRVGKYYHLNKTVNANLKGVKLIHIFEDEWFKNKNIVQSRISHILNKTENKINARDCSFKIVSKSSANSFLKENFLGFKQNFQICIGLYKDDILVSAMYFEDLGNNCFKICHFCNKLNHSVIGALSKIWYTFEREHNPEYVKTYVDLRWGEGSVFKRIGFSKEYSIPPKYYYMKTINRGRELPSKYNKDSLVKEGFDENKSEFEIMSDRKYRTIYDCGFDKYVWIKEGL